MHSAHSALFGALGGACLVLAIVWLRSETPDIAPGANLPQLPTGEALRPVLQVPATTTLDLSPLMDRLGALCEHLRRLETKLERVAASPERTPAVDSQKVVLDADTLLLAMEGVEKKKLEALSDEALRNQARLLMKEGGDVDGAIQRLESLLGRNLTPDKRADVLIELASMQRNQGEQGRAASVRTLQSVIDEHGINSRLGVTAAHQLVWSLAKDDPARALAVADAAMRSTAATPEQRITSRWAGAIMAQNVGDLVRARADYQSLLRELEGQPNQQKLADDIRRRLENL